MSSGTFLTASPSGTLTATTPSRGPLESFVPVISTGGTFPSFALKTHTEKFLSASPPSAGSLAKAKVELRADADDLGEFETLRVKCQREFVLKAKVERAEAKGEAKGKRRLFESGPAEGSVEDEMRRK
jgi:protein FRG1